MTRLAWVLAVLLVPLPASAQNVIDGPLPEPTATPMLEVPATVIEAPTSTRDELRAQLASQRAAHLAELRRYVEAGVFPINDVQPGALNVFMDPTGHLCAVANLMAFDGERAMVDQTAVTTNYVRLADVHEGALYDWILASGFTQEEIARIQEPYFFQEARLEQDQRERNMQREQQRLQRVLHRTLARLTRTTDLSLEIALDRLVAARSVSSTLS